MNVWLLFGSRQFFVEAGIVNIWDHRLRLDWSGRLDVNRIDDVGRYQHQKLGIAPIDRSGAEQLAQRVRCRFTNARVNRKPA